LNSRPRANIAHFLLIIAILSLLIVRSVRIAHPFLSALIPTAMIVVWCSPLANWFQRGQRQAYTQACVPVQP
jgi:predicted PurR-regulated permease PerM